LFIFYIQLRQTIYGRAFRVQNRMAKRTQSPEIKQKLKKERQKKKLGGV
jgi:hypothetical protein